MRILSFLLAIVFTFTSVQIDAHATGIGSQVTTSIGYSVTQSSSLIGKRESYSIQTGISGTVGSYTLPYSIIYLDKNIFEQPSQSDVSPAEFIQSVSIDSSDAQYYKIKVTYKNLTAGPPKKFPFSATLKNLRNAAGEQFTIKTALFDKDGVELTSDDENFTKSGYVAGIEAPDNGVTNPRMYLFKEFLVDSDVDSTHTKFSPDFQSDIKFTIQNGKKNLTNGEVTNRPTEGVDRRPVRVTITLPSNSVWDPSLPNNAGWTYNSADNTVTKDFTRTLPYFDTTITMKYGTNTTVATQYFPVKTILVNDDGTTDPTTERNGKVYREYEYVKKLKGTKYHLKYNYSVPVDPEYRHKYLITGGQYWGPTVAQNTTTIINTIIDEPWEKTEFTGYGIRVMDGFFDAANLAKISQNKLIGVNDDGSEEVIQANVPFETVNNITQMKADTVPISMTPKYYKSIKLVFDDEVTISKYGQDAIGLVLETKLTNAEFTRLKNNMAANPNPSSTNVTNTGKVQSYSNGVWTTISSNAVYIMREEYANMQLDKLSQTINGSTSSSITYAGNTMQYEMTVNYDNSYIFSQDRDVVDGKLIMLVDPELNFESITVGANAFFNLDANPTEVSNYAGTGKKAYIFDLNNFAFKKQQQSIFKRDNIKVNFKPDSSLSPGEHKVEAILSWSNNTDRPTSKDPHTVYSKDNTNYLDIYDSNENGSTTDRLSRIEWKFNFVPPQSVIINKLEKLESEPDSAYRAKMKAEKDEIVQYRIMAYNNSGADASALHFIDVFPYVGDKNVVKDYAGNYVDRGSKFATILQGPVTAPAGYTMYYSTDTPKGTLPENLANNWVSESAITDWSQVTMFKAEMNPGVKLSRDDRQYFTYKVKMPDTSNLDENDTSNNSIATWYGNNIDGANENINSKVGIIKYEVSGKAYYDVNDDGKYDAGDVLIANRPVKLIKDGTVIAETTTDANGDYVFKNKITNAGGYTVVAEMLTSDTMIASNPSTGSTIGQDFDSTQSDNSTMFSGQTSTWAKKDLTLTKVKHKAVENLGLKNNVSNLKVQHIKEDDNNPLVPEVTTTAGVGTPYTTAPITTDPNYEVDTTQLPTNATGTYATTDTTVVYKYKRKNAGKVVVHHYLVGTTTELYTPAGKTSPSPEELDGTNKLGLPYTTTDKASDPALSNYELVTPGPTNATGTFTTGEQTVNYYYRRKNAGKVIVHHYEVGHTTELYTPAGKTSPSPEELDGTEKLGLPYTTQSREADIQNFELTTPAPTNATGTFTTGVQEVTYYYKRKNAGKVTVHHYLLGTTTELYTPAGKTSPSPEELDGTGKLGLPYTTTDKTSDPALSNYELVTPAPTNATGTFQSGEQTVTYYYRRKNAGNITVNHYEVGTTTQLYSPTPGGTPSAQNFNGNEKLGLSENITNKVADIANYEYVNVDVTGATGASTPNTADGATTVTYIAGNQVINYYYRRKNAGNVVVNYLEQGTNTVLATQETLDGTGKLGSAFTTVQKNVNDYDFVTVSPAANGTFTTGTQTVNYYYKRKNAGNVVVNYLEQGTNTVLATQETLDGTGKLGSAFTTVQKNINDYDFVSVSSAANGTFTSGTQTVNYYYKRKDVGDVVVKYVEQGTNTPLDTPTTMSGAGKSGLTYTTTPKTITDYELVVTPANHTGTYPATGTTTVVYEYRRKNAGNITVNHYEVGGSTQLYTPSGSTTPSAQNFDGTNKLGLSENLTNKAADIANYEYVSVDVSGASGATTPAANGDTTVTYKAGNQVVTYRYKRKDAANIIVHHVEDGTTTELYTPAGASSPSAVTYPGAGKLGTTESLTNKAADIANYEYVGVDTAGASSATTPSATGDTTLTYGSTPQTVTYKYRRKNAGKVTVHHYLLGTTTELYTPAGKTSPSPEELDGTNKLGLPYTTSDRTSVPELSDYELVTPAPTNATGTFQSGDQTVTYYYRRKNAGNITVNHYEVGTTTQLYSPTPGGTPSAQNFNGTGKLGLSENITNKEADIANYEYVNVDVAGAAGASTPNTANGATTVTYVAGNQVVNYYYRRKNAANITVHHYEVGTTNELFTPTGASSPSAVVIDGSGRLGQTENLNNEAANIANYEYVSVDVSGASSATTPSATGATTLTNGSTPQTVIYYYRRKNAGNVVVNYLEQGTNTVLDTQETLDGTNKLGSAFTTVQKNINDYDFVSVSPAASGTFTSGTQTVNYYYKRKNAGNVVVNYLEQGTNAVLATQETLDGTNKLGSAFTTVQKNINDYDFVSVSSAANGTFTSGTQTVNYYYKRKDVGDVVVKYVEQGTNTPIDTPTTMSGAGKSGLTYTTTPKTIPDYDLVVTPANHTGTYPATGTTTVVYEYKRKNAGDVTVHHYIDGTTTQLVPDVTLSGTGKLGTPYTTTDHNIPNYTLVSVPSNANGTFTTGNQTVTYYYRRNDAGNVVVNYLEQGTNAVVANQENIDGTGQLGLPFTTVQKNINDFDFVSVSPAANGTFASGTQTVNYYYKRKDAADVTVKYVEQGTGTPLSGDDVLGGTNKLGLPYTTTEKNITDYELVAQPSNKNGTFLSTPQTVIYEYRRKPAGDVTSVYVDEGGNQIDIPETQSGTGKLGLPYTTTRKTIPNYTLVSVPSNENGTFVPGPQTVTYVYRRNDAGDVTVYHKSVYDNSDLSTPTVLDGTRKLGLPYTTTPETYSDFEIATVPSNATGTFVSGSQSVTYLYKRKQSGGVTVNYLDNHGNRIETPDNITGTDNVGLPYTTTPKNIPNYTLITVPNNANGTFTVSPITVNYIYKRQDAGNVVIEHVDEDGNVPLDTPEVLDGSERLGDNYTSSSKSFDNYDLVSVPSNANGTFISTTQTVTYVYRRKDAGNVIAHYVNTAGLPIESDEVLDGTRKLGLPYATGAKTIPGYSLYLVQGSETGVFTSGTTEVTYIYRKDPSVVITPVPPVTPTPIAPSPINPINPIDPINPVTPINPLTPSPITPINPVNPSPINPITPSPITPGRIATPSQIITPGREQDLVIRPNRPMATPSIATGSNGRKGGGGSSDGNSSVRPTKTVTVQDTNNTIEKPKIIIDEPNTHDKNPQPDKGNLNRDIKSSISDTRRALSVPKTQDDDKTPIYGLMMLISSALAALCIFKKKKS